MKSTHKSMIAVLLTALMLWSILPMGVSAAEDTVIDVYFDNYYTRFQGVELYAYRNGEKLTFPMADAGDGLLKTSIPTNLKNYGMGIYADRPLRATYGGPSICYEQQEKAADGRTVVTGYLCLFYNTGMPEKDSVIHMDLQTLVFSTTPKASYERKVYTADPGDEPDAFSVIDPFESAPSQHSLLTVGDTHDSDSWRYQDGYLYLGEKEPFVGSIVAKGDLTVVVNGNDNVIDQLKVDGSLTVDVVTGSLNICNDAHGERGVTGESAVFNVSSWGKLTLTANSRFDVAQMYLNVCPGGHAVFRMAESGGELMAKTKQLYVDNRGEIDFVWMGGGSSAFVQCETANIQNKHLIQCFWGGGGSNKCFYATEQMVVTGNEICEFAGGGGENYVLYSDKPMQKNTEKKDAAHYIHVGGEWIPCVAAGKSEPCAYATRCVLCGTLTDYVLTAVPTIPRLIKRYHTAIVLKANSAYEYSLDGKTWQRSNVFEGLQPNTVYSFRQRLAIDGMPFDKLESGVLSVSTTSECRFDQEEVDDKYLASEANCMNAATYKFSCLCGEAGTEVFGYGDAGEHRYDGKDPNVCSVCGEGRKDASAEDTTHVPEETEGIETAFPENPVEELPQLELKGCFSTLVPQGALMGIALLSVPVLIKKKKNAEKANKERI